MKHMLACCRLALALPALSALATLPACSACPPGPDQGQVMQEGAVALAWLSQPRAITVGQPFELRVQLCPSTLALKRVDAQMPEHRHGMNYRPSVTPLGDGVWRVQGLLWHMAGRWELRLDVVDESGLPTTLRQSVVLR
jgi:hypothetical protein